MQQGSGKIAFGFSKIAPPKKLAAPIESKLQDNESKTKKPESKIEYLDSIDEKGLQMKDKGDVLVKNSELVIPVQEDTFRIQKQKKTAQITKELMSGNADAGEQAAAETPVSKQADNGEASEQPVAELRSEADLTALAVQELLTGSETVIDGEPVQTIGMVASEQQSTEAQLAEEPTADAYEQVPIPSFGLAALRGMGWNPETGIGRGARKRVVKVSDVEMRPHRLGLGADQAAAASLGVTGRRGGTSAAASGSQDVNAERKYGLLKSKSREDRDETAGSSGKDRSRSRSRSRTSKHGHKHEHSRHRSRSRSREKERERDSKLSRDKDRGRDRSRSRERADRSSNRHDRR